MAETSFSFPRFSIFSRGLFFYFSVVSIVFVFPFSKEFFRACVFVVSVNISSRCAPQTVSTDYMNGYFSRAARGS